ncbi:di-trans,poly-cis-decaprenylcistransferase [Helicobacter cetorum]|uniref:di-trans,poly-cis-decaprenylcistransferase n=1 Tax=Helicobacter cetorum TaxID=138563 RepID=UPI000CF19F09|nr:di-trans,poly-cis-decaprenylcistransferase [Helicobacter cetorum]
MNNTLKHLAIIMDGNGRWARLQNKARAYGHKKGVKTLKDITIYCANKKLECLTLYAFSTENWKRPKSEVDFLMKMLKKYLKDERPTYLNNHIRFKAIGDLEGFSKELKDTILQLEEDTKHFKDFTQVLALNYGSKNELTRAFKSLLETPPQSTKILGSTKNLENLEQEISRRLDTHDLPEVDLLLRTGGEMRLSNFLLWQSSYAELFFTPILWPDFTPKDLENIISDFYKRVRKFGELKC